MTDYTHKGRPESSDLSGWIEWAENIDDCTGGESSSEWENSGGQYDFQLVSIDYVMELHQQVTEMKIDSEEFCRLLITPKRDKHQGVKDE